MKNCYTWAREQIAYHGGELVIAWSSRWFLHFHIIYVKPDGTMWGYEPDDKSYFSMWRFITGGGWTFSGHTTEYETCIPFMDGLKAAIMMELMAAQSSLKTFWANLWVRLSWPL